MGYIKMYNVILYVMEENDSFCMDDDDERIQLAQKVADALTDNNRQLELNFNECT